MLSSARRSRSRKSGDSYREDLQNPPSEGKSATARSGQYGIEAQEVPPFNQDIEEFDDLVEDEPNLADGESMIY